MTITSIQKVIKVGSSLAVTIPAKEAAAAGIVAGENLEVSLQRLDSGVTDHATEVVELTQRLIARHREALKHLSQR